MAVLVEAVSVIIACESLERTYRGGAHAFADFARKVNNSYCCDGELARIGFTSPEEARSFVEKMAFFGLVHVKDGSCVDLVIADQRAGLLQRCAWADFGIADLPGEPAPKVAACRLRGSTIADVTVPEGWRYESSITGRMAKDEAAAAARVDAARANAARTGPPEAGLAVFAKKQQAQAPLELKLGLRRVKK